MVDGLPVDFPYGSIYKEQYDYMCQLKRCLDAQVYIYASAVVEGIL